MSHLDNRLPPPIVMVVIAALMLAAARATPVVAINPAVTATAALILFVTAGAFAFPAILAFRRARTTINPVQVDAASTLVTSGVFGMSRNPMYVSMALLLCAWTAFLAAPLAVLGPIGFVAFIDRFQIRPEERALLAKFGQSYQDYRQRVRRWL